MNATEDKQRRTAHLAEYVEVDTSDERVSRLWERVSTELEATNLERGRLDASEFGSWNLRLTGRVAIASLAVAAVIAVALGGKNWLENRDAMVGATSVAALSQATLETSSDSLAVDLEDGSRMELAAHSRLSVQKQVRDEFRLKLDQGKVECDVVHNPKRQFFVQTSGVIVRVTGTRFSVDVKNEEAANGESAQYVEVGVSRGSVEIQRTDGTMPVRRLAAGERWAMRISDGVTPGATAEGQTTRDPALNTSGGNSPSPSNALRKSAGSPEPAEDARELLEKGRVARREGNPQAAAQAYQQLLSQYPQDSRAGLAAFELGRLRMDRLGDLKGAIAALNQAVQLAPGANVREDAMARLVDAYHRTGNDDNCASAQRAYLTAFPAGVHAATVRLRCDD
jgi:ferric-dicitrate binding protein FerR (iron transport regulator)